MHKSDVVNVKMISENTILRKTDSIEEITGTVLKHLLETRPVTKAGWNPYIYMKDISYRKTRKHDIYVEMNKIYPEAKCGDVCYVSGNINIEKDYTVWINMVGLVSVFLDGKCIFKYFD